MAQVSGLSLGLAVLLVGGILSGRGDASAAERPSAWDAPDRAAKVAALIPGRQVPRLSPDDLFAAWTRGQVVRWERDHKPLADEEAYRRYAATAPTDDELLAGFPDHISPFGLVVSGQPESWKAEEVLIYYCPFCGKRHTKGFGPRMVEWDPNNRYHAVTLCCRQDLYGREQDFPPDYKLRPNGTAKFPHLDGTIAEVPGYTFTDKEGVTWQLFLKTFFDHMRWNDLCGSLNSDVGKTGLYGKEGLVGVYLRKFKETADPVYAHKLAVLLDHIADTYYGLPLSFRNEIAKGKDGQPLTRAEWEAQPRPAVFTKCPLGEWNRMNPLMARGWLTTEREQRLAEPFARVRHHPAFRYYSQKKYGDPDALDRKITTRLMREVALMLESGIGSALTTEYQFSSDTETLILAILAQDKFLFDLAAGAMDCILYNHHYHDGMNGEGAAGYMAMLGGYYSYLQAPLGWREFVPEYAAEHPFAEPAATEWQKLRTVRGMQPQFGDNNFPPGQPFPAADSKVAANEKLPSMNWPAYGMGLLRVGGAGHRMETLLSYDKVSLHGCADKLGIETWVDGVPVMLPGGYAMYWMGAYLDQARPDVQELLALPYPREIRQAGLDGNGWSWQWSHCALTHNAVTVNEVGTSLGWSDNEGLGDLITYKGGEAVGELGASFQVLDARDLCSFERRGVKVEEFRRALLAVEGPGGRPYVVDVVKLRGGQRHALFQHAWGDRAEAQLPPPASQESSLARYLCGNRELEKLPNYQDVYRPFEQFTHVQPLQPASGTWSLTWKTDWATYGPFDPATRRQSRTVPEDVGRVRLRLIGMQEQSDTALISARGPWAPYIEQPLSGGRRIEGVVGFRDAFDYLIQTRKLTEGKQGETLNSTFVSLLEGYREGETSAIKGVTRLLPAQAGGVPEGSVGLQVNLAGGVSDSVIFQPQPGPARFEGGLETDAGYALLRRDAAGEVVEAHFVRGTTLKCGRFSATIPGDLQGTLVDVIGDLTGTRQESALIVRPQERWPVGTGLAAKSIAIETLTPLRAANHEVYTIEKVTALPEGLLRVDLANHGPFAWGWHSVGWIDPDHPDRLKTNRPLIAGINTPWLWGAQAWFPELGQTYTIRKTASDRVSLELADAVDLKARGVKVGDWFVIYTIQPGQKVTVRGEFSWRKDR